MKGYKAFNSDWTCRGFQYKVGEIYEMDGDIKICSRGFHFCRNLKDCFCYYPFDHDTKIAEVEILGDIKEDAFSPKCCTNKIKIIREIRFEDLIYKTEDHIENITVPENSTITTKPFFRISHVFTGLIIPVNFEVLKVKESFMFCGKEYKTVLVKYKNLVSVSEKGEIA